MNTIPTIQHTDTAAEDLARADDIYFDLYVEHWESLSGPVNKTTVAEADARLITFAGSALLGEIGNRTIGPAPYAEWGVRIDGKTVKCGHWGVDPDAKSPAGIEPA